MSATGPRQEEEEAGEEEGGKSEKRAGVNQNDSGSQCRLCLSGW